MNKSMLLALSVSAGLCAAGALRADNAAVGASTSASGTAAAATSATASAATVAPNDAPGSLKAGKDLLNAGKFADAIAYFNGIGAQVADHGKMKREPYRQLDLATAYLGIGQYDQAETAAQAALAILPDLEPAWNDLGSAQVNAGDRAAAVATYQKGIAQLTKDGADHDRLDANLQSLQAAAGDTDQSSGAAASAVSGTSGAAAPAASSPAATVGN